eukprot:COSAG02_NODE_62211_length_266_cov_0.922156_1_plen_27_part_01
MMSLRLLCAAYALQLGTVATATAAAAP